MVLGRKPGLAIPLVRNFFNAKLGLACPDSCFILNVETHIMSFQGIASLLSTHLEQVCIQFLSAWIIYYLQDGTTMKEKSSAKRELREMSRRKLEIVRVKRPLVHLLYSHWTVSGMLWRDWLEKFWIMSGATFAFSHTAPPENVRISVNVWKLLKFSGLFFFLKPHNFTFN